MRSAAVAPNQPSRRDPAPRAATRTEAARRPRHRSILALATGLLVAATSISLGGCGATTQAGLTPLAGPGESPERSAEASAPESDRAASPSSDPDAVLNGLAAALHTEVDRLKRGLRMRTDTRFLDERQECRIGADDWPAQWILDERIYLNTTDARPAARILVAHQKRAGWSVQVRPPADGADQYVLSKAGFAISIAAGDNDGSLNLQTNGPCVNADGSVQRNTGTAVAS
jgi:hypothetical protein